MRVIQSKFTKKKLANFQTVWRAGHESAFVKLEEIILFVLFYAWFMACKGYT